MEHSSTTGAQTQKSAKMIFGGSIAVLAVIYAIAAWRVVRPALNENDIEHGNTVDSGAISTGTTIDSVSMNTSEDIYTTGIDDMQYANQNASQTTESSLPPLAQDIRICHVSSEECWLAAVASTPAERSQGLMWRTELLENTGMLFVFDQEGKYGFWMKNTKIPLGIIWIDQELRTVDRTTMQPCVQDPCPTYAHTGMALFALEIPEKDLDALAIASQDKRTIQEMGSE